MTTTKATGNDEKDLEKDERQLENDEKETKTNEKIIKRKQWQCTNCNLFNPNDTWRCCACFSNRKVQKDEFKDSIPLEMNGLLKEEGGGIGYSYLTNLKVNEPGIGEVLVKSFRVGICGSDLILYDWTKDAALIAKCPFTPGHEVSGLVVKTGEKCGLKVGQRVAIENHLFCGQCFQCKHKRKDICSNLNQFGHGKGTIYGGCEEYFIIKAEYCYRLRKKETTWNDAALLEPLGVALNACDQAEVRSNIEDSILVIGAGTIGCLAVGVCKAYKVRKVICVDTVNWKLSIAKKYGANVTLNYVDSSKTSLVSSLITNIKNIKGDNNKEEEETKHETINSFDELRDFINKETNGVGVGRIIECSGNTYMMSNMFKLLRKGGTVVLVGLPKEDLIFKNAMTDLVFKSCTIRSIHGRRIFDTWKRAEELISERKINVSHVITHEMELSKFEDGFKALKSGNALKVLFDPTK